GGTSGANNGPNSNVSRPIQESGNGRGNRPEMPPQSVPRPSGGNMPSNIGRTQTGGPRDMGNPRMSASDVAGHVAAGRTRNRLRRHLRPVSTTVPRLLNWS